MARQTRIQHSGRRIADSKNPTKGLAARLPYWLPGLIVCIAVATAVYVLTYTPVSDPDTWFHLALGEYLQQNGRLPEGDIFSYTSGSTPYVSSGWLTALLMAWLEGIYPESMLGSMLGPILMVMAVVGLAAAIILWRAARRGTIFMTGLLLMAGLTLAAVRFSPRPDVWSLLGITALLALLTGQWRAIDQGRVESKAPKLWRLWLLTPLIITWANLHAGVLVAVPFLITYGAWLLFRFSKTRDAAWAIAAVPVTLACVAWLLNPYGIGIAGLAWRIAQIPQVGWVMEWMPLFKSGFPNAWPIWVAGAILVSAFLWLVAMNRRAFHPLEITWMLMLVAMALLQRRQVGLLGMGATLLLSGHLVGAEAWVRRRAAWAGIIAPVLVAAAVVWLQISGENGRGGGRPGYGRNCTTLPCIAADFLAENPPPKQIFNSYGLGGYLLFRLYPETKVFIDGRLDTYPHQVWLDMLAGEENRFSIDELIARYGISTFVIGVRDSFGDPMHIASRLAGRPDFVLVHLDDVAAVFVRKTADNIAYTTTFGYGAISPWNLDKMRPLLGSGERAQQLINETGRLLEQSGLSATAAATAAYIAWLVGDEITMNEQLAQARSRDLGNRQLRIVEQRMASGRR